LRECGGLRLLWQERICRLWPSAGAASMWPPVGMASPGRLALVVLGAARLSVTAAARRGRGMAGGRWPVTRSRPGAVPFWPRVLSRRAVRRLRPAVRVRAWGNLRRPPRMVACMASRPR